MPKNKTKAARACAKVLIVDDHPAVREALAIRIAAEPDLKVCGEAEDVAGALKVAADTNPDVAVVDIGLKAGSGIDLIKRLKSHHKKLRTIVWSMYSEHLYAERALRAGALAYLTKGQATESIIAAIRQVLEGKLVLSAEMTRQFVKRGVGLAEPGQLHAPTDKLSDRELEVFRLIGQGVKTQEIGAQLHLSIKTVETYRDRIRAKLGLSDGTALAQAAMLWALERK